MIIVEMLKFPPWIFTKKLTDNCSVDREFTAAGRRQEHLGDMVYRCTPDLPENAGKITLSTVKGVC
jgi:hypothetical protein